MKKALLCILLAAAMILCGCNDSSTESNPPQTTADAPTDYTQTVCRDAQKFIQKTYAFEDSSRFVNLYFSFEWLIKTNESGMSYSIIRGKDTIGQLYTGEYTPEPGSYWEILEEKSTEYLGLTIAEYVERDRNAKDSVRCRYLYSYVEDNETKSINLTVNYAEAGENIRYELYEHVDFEELQDHTGFGTLSRVRDGKILILGNSFIGTSAIGSILTDMVNANGKPLKVEAISRGYAKVETYTNDADLMYKIEHGTYNAVFICGFYNSEQIAELGILKAACDKPNTELIIFPAHNESRTVINNAASIYPSLMLMDWKNEIDLLIDQGVSKSDMCIDDAHQHSTQLAGYVGAHMIYRAIFGEVPSEPLSSYANLQGTVDQTIKKYSKNGSVFEVDYYLK